MYTASPHANTARPSRSMRDPYDVDAVRRRLLPRIIITARLSMTWNPLWVAGQSDKFWDTTAAQFMLGRCIDKINFDDMEAEHAAALSLKAMSSRPL